MRRAVYSLDIQPRMERYAEVFALTAKLVMSGLFRDEFLPTNAHSLLPTLWSEMSPLCQWTDELGGFQFLELRASLPDELLMYADKLSMAHSLELRVPYLDYTIVEYAERLPASYKLKMFRGKRIHREVCKRYLSHEIMTRRKRGFAADVVDSWFQDSMSTNMSDHLLSGESLIYRYLRRESVKQLLLEHRARRANHYKLLFSLTVLEEWLRQWDAS